MSRKPWLWNRTFRRATPNTHRTVVTIEWLVPDPSIRVDVVHHIVAGDALIIADRLNRDHRPRWFHGSTEVDLPGTSCAIRNSIVAPRSTLETLTDAERRYILESDQNPLLVLDQIAKRRADNAAAVRAEQIEQINADLDQLYGSTTKESS